MSNQYKINLTPLKPGLCAGSDNIVHVLAAVEAPDAPQGFELQRSPLNLALVIDQSGSMAGMPLEEAKRCAAHVVSKLRSTDRVALVSYDDDPIVLATSRAAGEHQGLLDAIASIDNGGCTNLHGGWLAGAEQVSPHVNAGSISRVMLLSDGRANRGLTQKDQILAQCSALAAAGVSTSTYGLGNNFDEELMTGMARAGRGNSYYGKSAEDLFDPIEEELQLLNAICARDVKLQIRGRNGSSVEFMNAHRQLGPESVALPDLAFDAEAWVLLRIRLTADQMRAHAEGSMLDLVDVTADMTLRDGGKMTLGPTALSMPVLSADQYLELRSDARVKSRLAEVEVSEIERAAREAALQGDWGRVEYLIDRALEAGHDSAWATRALHALREIAQRRDRELMSKEAMYSSERMHSRLSSKSGSMRTDFSERAYLREKSLSGQAEPRNNS